MEIPKKLESIVKIDLSGLRKFKNNIQLSLKINSDNKNITISGPVINIPVNSLKGKEQEELQALIREILNVEKIPILQEDTSKLLGEFRNVDSQPETQQLIGFFKGKIPPNDIDILRQAVFIKVTSDKGENIKLLKDGVIKRYGNRGRNICNLYTAGYFTSQIKPIWEEMFAQPDYNPTDFNEAYERIVTESPYALFVSATMNDNDLETEVRNKIRIDKSYGISYLNIHGIGYDNVQKIIKLVDKLRSEFSLPEEIQLRGNVIVAKIHF